MALQVSNNPIEELTKSFKSIMDSVESHQPPDQCDVDTCTKLLCELNESLDEDGSECTACAYGLLETMQIKMTELFDSESSLKMEVQQLKSVIEDLQHKVKNLEKLAQTRETKSEKQDERILKQDERMLKQDERILKLEASVKDLQEDNQILIVCQMAFAIENIVVNTVLLNNYNQEFPSQTIKDMEEKLEEQELDKELFATTKEKEVAISQWEHIQAEIKYSRKSKACLGTVKSTRCAIAHPAHPPDIVRSTFEELKKTKKDRNFQRKKSSFEWCLRAYEKLHEIFPNAKELT